VLTTESEPDVRLRQQSDPDAGDRLGRTNYKEFNFGRTNEPRGDV